MRATNKIDLKQLTIFSENGKEIDISRGLVELLYHESLLENSVKVTATFVDTGYRENEDNTGVFEEDGLDIQGGEKVYLKLEDDLENVLNFGTDDYQLRILRVPNNIEHTQKTAVTIELCTKEYILNELEDYYITKRYDGKISDSVTKILKEVLQTPKKLFIEETINNFNFLGHVEKVFHKLVWLAKRSVPNLPGIKGQSAGFFFYETSDGFNYKSIDSLLKQKPKRKLIFNNTTLTPEDYDANILNSPVFSPTIDVMKKLRLGTYDNKLVTFDLYTNDYKEKLLDADENSAAELAGKKLPKIPEEFKIPSRRSTALRDTGVLPPGNTLSVQLEKAKETNFEIEDILNQSFMRYNQLFAVRTSITIYSDLELRAGDIIFCDFPELSSKANQIISNKKSGKYLIVDLTHYVSPNGPSYTKCNIVRDSYYRKTA